MKKIIRISSAALFLTLFFARGYSQEVGGENEGTYLKSNIAFNKFKVLGVNNKQYAKCVESENFQDPSKRVRYIMIDKTEFTDDGKNFDLVANDGIMTSTVGFNYLANEPVIATGVYVTVKDSPVVFDHSFAHVSKIDINGRFGGPMVECDMRWQSCSEWPSELQSICRNLSWPFNGQVIFYNCKVVWKFF